MNKTHSHGGQLHAASITYDRPLEEWLDLSTGISPWPYPLPDMPVERWQRLPEADDGLEQAATAYYGSDHLLAVSGSQEAINLLPLLRGKSRVGIISPAYHSHQQAWENAGHEVITTDSNPATLSDLDVLLVVNPTNPTTQRFSTEQLMQWHQQLSEHGGWLIVDEAFIDATPQHSLIQRTSATGLIVLRSIGKFFGLAGIRLGFVWAEQQLLSALAAQQNDWSVANPARWAGTQALTNTSWQHIQSKRILQGGQRLRMLLNSYLDRQAHPGSSVREAGLVAYLALDDKAAAHALHQRLCNAGILARQFDNAAALRFGLPGNEMEWQRLQDALLR